MTQTAATLPPLNERVLIGTLLAVQFINFVDYMMVMPLAPDFAAALDFPVSSIGFITGSYSVAASLIGFIGAFMLDHVARKRALLLCLFGTSLLTVVTAFVTSLPEMLAARFFTGMFAGPLTGLCAAMVADYIPPERRGAAMGKLMGALALGSVFGVPIGLELARFYNWQAPFIAVGAAGLITCVWAAWALPYYKPFDGTRAPFATRLQALRGLLSQRIVLASYGIMALAMFAGFMLIPHIAAHVQLNLHFPRDQMGLLYLVAGAISFFSMRWAGRMVDRTTATVVGTGFSVAFALVIFGSIVWQAAWLPVMVSFPLFMILMSGRGVAAQTLASKVAPPQQRGSYLALQSSLISFATALAGFTSGLIVYEADGRLQNMEYVGVVAIVITLLVPFLFAYVERHLQQGRGF